MNSILHIAAFLALLWFTHYCYSDLNNAFLAVVALCLACWVLVLTLYAIWHDARAMFASGGEED